MKTQLSRKLIEEHLKNFSTIQLSAELADYRKQILSTNEDFDPRDLFVYLQNEEDSSGKEKLFNSIFTIMQKLAEYVVFKENNLLKVLGKQNLDVTGIKQRDSSTFLGYARIDTILNDQGIFEVAEFNSRRPQMYEDTDWFGEVLKLSFPHDKLNYRPITELILTSALKQFKLNKNRTPENVVLISDFAEREYYFSISKKIEMIFKDSNIIKIKCKDTKRFYESLEFQEDFLNYKGVRIDLIIPQSICLSAPLFDRSGKIVPIAIREAYHNNSVELYPSPASQITGTKQALDLLKDQDFISKLNLSIDEKNVLSIIPESFSGEDYTRISNLDKNKYVIKLAGRGQGAGVIQGNELNDEDWAKLYTSLLNRKSKFIIQRKIEFGIDEIFSLKSNQYEEAYLTSEPFVINIPGEEIFVGGYASRAVPKELHRPTLKFNPAYNKPEIYFGTIIST